MNVWDASLQRGIARCGVRIGLRFATMHFRTVMFCLDLKDNHELVNEHGVLVVPPSGYRKVSPFSRLQKQEPPQRFKGNRERRMVVLIGKNSAGQFPQR